MVNLQLVKLCLDRPGLQKGEARSGSAARRVTRFASQYSSDIGGHEFSTSSSATHLVLLMKRSAAQKGQHIAAE